VRIYLQISHLTYICTHALHSHHSVSLFVTVLNCSYLQTIILLHHPYCIFRLSLMTSELHFSCSGLQADFSSDHHPYLWTLWIKPITSHRLTPHYLSKEVCCSSSEWYWHGPHSGGQAGYNTKRSSSGCLGGAELCWNLGWPICMSGGSHCRIIWAQDMSAWNARHERWQDHQLFHL